MTTAPLASFGFLAVKNLDKYQHYRDRPPVWIKLYQSLLDDYEFCRLMDQSKYLFVGLILIAVRMNNHVPADPAWLANRLSMTSTPDVKALVRAGLVVTEKAKGRPRRAKSASTVPYNPASVEEKREEERREEERPASAGPSATPFGRFRDHCVGTWEAKYGASASATWTRADWPNLADAFKAANGDEAKATVAWDRFLAKGGDYHAGHYPRKFRSEIAAFLIATRPVAVRTPTDPSDSLPRAKGPPPTAEIRLEIERAVRAEHPEWGFDQVRAESTKRFNARRETAC